MKILSTKNLIRIRKVAEKNPKLFKNILLEYGKYRNTKSHGKNLKNQKLFKSVVLEYQKSKKNYTGIRKVTNFFF